jgi:DNA mismatch repair protein MutS2
MDAKSIQVLELPKILERLSAHASFSASAALARALAPSTDLREIVRWQQETAEARKLLAVKTDVTIGGARDVRGAAQLAARAGMLDAAALLDIKATIIAGRTLRRIFSKLGDQFPRLTFIAQGLEEIPGVVEAITRTIDERGEVLDSASEKLAQIRRELKVAHGRLMQKLDRILGEARTAQYLQENLVTQRDGRYVIPLKADFKGRIRGVVHDQSASGATIFIEPLATVELNNALRELQLAEQSEIRRILTELSAFIGEQAEPIVQTVDTLAELDVAFAKAKYADAIRAHEPLLTADDRPQTTDHRHPPASGHQSSVIQLLSARHPLLNPDTVVPIEVEMEAGTRALVITGPNTGGKTVTLKTVGLLVLMAQCGLHLPAQSGSALPVFQNVFADIGDEQSIEQSLSTFSAHFTNITRILNQVDEHSLVILDELGAGTDPGEGSALARAVLSYLLDMGATALVATHYPELKGYAQTRPGVKNASMEFDPETLLPTFHLTIGLPGRSNAFAIAARLGLHPTIIEDARTMVAETSLESEQLLDEIYRQREAVRADRERAEAARAEAEESERQLARRLDGIEAERRKIIEGARAEAQREAEELREQLSQLKVKLARAAQSTESLKDIESEIESVEDKVAVPAAPLPQTQPAAKIRAVRLGDTVKLKALNQIGTVTALTAAEAEVKVGRLRVRTKLDEVEFRGPASDVIEEAESEIKNPESKTESPGLELDIRGKTVEEALPELEQYLDQAYLAELPWVRVIHGKGTGKLRQAVRDFLRNHPQVKSHATGAENEGGEGVTVVKLAVGN